MRILYFYRGLVHSTQKIHIHAMIRAWRKLGHEVLECFPLSESESSASAAATRVRRLPLLLRNAAQIMADRPASKALAGAHDQFRPDFIYERYALFSRCAGDVARRASIPLIMEVNSPVAHLESQQVSPILRLWGRKRERGSLMAADALVTVSGAQAQRLASLGLPTERIHVTHNAIDPADFQDLVRHRERARERLGVEKKCAFILLQSWDDATSVNGVVDTLSQAAAGLGGEVDSILLLCVGGGHLLPKVKEGIGAAFPHAIFVGAVPHDEVYPFLAAADAALIPWHHAFTSPLKLFEYMAAGLPVIAPDLGGIAEVLRHRETGLLFEPGNGRALGEAMLQLSRHGDLRSRLGEAAHREVFEKYTWESNACMVANLALSLRAARAT